MSCAGAAMVVETDHVVGEPAGGLDDVEGIGRGDGEDRQPELHGQTLVGRDPRLGGNT